MWADNLGRAFRRDTRDSALIGCHICSAEPPHDWVVLLYASGGLLRKEAWTWTDDHGAQAEDNGSPAFFILNSLVLVKKPSTPDKPYVQFKNCTGQCVTSNQVCPTRMTFPLEGFHACNSWTPWHAACLPSIACSIGLTVLLGIQSSTDEKKSWPTVNKRKLWLRKVVMEWAWRSYLDLEFSMREDYWNAIMRAR